MGGGGGKSLKVNDLFIVPDFDELKSVAAGPGGEPRMLNEDQLDQLRRTGQFEVMQHLKVVVVGLRLSPGVGP